MTAGWPQPYGAGPGAAMNVRAEVLVLRARLLVRRADRRRRRDLARELSSYRTCAERTDLAAACARYPDGQTRELRDLLAPPAAASAAEPVATAATLRPSGAGRRPSRRASCRGSGR